MKFYPESFMIEFLKQVKSASDPAPGLSPAPALISHNTARGGNSLFHAIFGVPVDGEYYDSYAKEKREIIAQTLWDCAPHDALLPVMIQSILSVIATDDGRISKAPVLSALKKKYKERCLSGARDFKIDVNIISPVLRDYANLIRQGSYAISRDELELVSRILGLRLELYTGVATFEGLVSAANYNSELNATPVKIYFKGSNDYEHMDNEHLMLKPALPQKTEVVGSMKSWYTVLSNTGNLKVIDGINIRDENGDKVILAVLDKNDIKFLQYMLHNNSWQELDMPYDLTNADSCEHKYCSTIKIANFQHKKNQYLILLAKAEDTLKIWRYNITQKAWSEGVVVNTYNKEWWENQSYYSTLNIDIINNNDKPIALISWRDNEAIKLYGYDPFKKMGQFLQNGPKWGGNPLWALEVYYGTIQTMVMRHNGKEKLHILGRSPNGTEMWRYDNEANSWTPCAYKDWQQVGAGVGNWQAYYGRLKAVVVSGNNSDKLFLVAKSNTYMELLSYDPETELSRSCITQSECNPTEWNHIIQAYAINIDNTATLMLLGKNATGIKVSSYILDAENITETSDVGPELLNVAVWANEKCYSDIKTLVTCDGTKELLLLLGFDLNNRLYMYVYDPTIKGRNAWRRLSPSTQDLVIYENALIHITGTGNYSNSSNVRLLSYHAMQAERAKMRVAESAKAIQESSLFSSSSRYLP